MMRKGWRVAGVIAAFVAACKMATDLDPATGPPALPADPGQILAPACTRTSIAGVTAIPSLGTSTYLGSQGGNYPGGSNVMPPAHVALGYRMAAEVQPRDGNGNVDLVNGKIVQVSVGASTAARVFAGDSAGIAGIYANAYKPLADADASKNPRLIIVNGAQKAKSIRSWLVPSDTAWLGVDYRLSLAGVTPAQVQVVWFMLGETRPPVYGFPLEQENYRDSMEVVIRMFKQRYPNTRLAYLTTHYYQGYRPGTGPEPNNFEQGFGLKWIIEDQIAGRGNMNADPDLGPVVAPWVGWGAHLFSNGIVPNDNGLSVVCADYDTAGIHFIRGGVDKAGPRLVAGFKSDPFAASWWFDNTGQVGDVVWYDVDGNGIQDAGEPGLAGLTVTLVGPGVNRTGTTNGSGQYAFSGLPAGSYTVSVATPDGFVPTTVHAPGSTASNDSDGSPAGVTLATNATADASIDIGFTRGTGAIGNFVWNDLNRDGIQDVGEPGLAGVQVTLSGSATATTTTGANGDYVFAGLLAGNYTVTVATPAGFSPSPSNQGSDPLKDSNASPVTVTLPTNSSTDLAVDAGFVENQTGEIGDLVWYDADGNGVQDAGEQGLAGVDVTLSGPGGVRSTTTDSTGHYVFSGLGVGTYTLSVTTPSGYVLSPTTQGNDAGTDSDGSPATVTLGTNASREPTIDVGFTRGMGTIGDFVWDDVDGDGIQDVGEPGLPGVQVILSGAASAQTVTDASGFYSFGALFAGDYTVAVATPPGYVPSPAGQGGNPLQDSDGSPASVTLMTNTGSHLSTDFGFVQIRSGQIGDVVWYDVDGNGIQDMAEPGIGGVDVTLSGPGGPVTVATDGSGHYLFSGLAAGSYTVSVATPSGFVPTVARASGSTSDNDSDDSPATVTLATSGSSDVSIDFGFTKDVGVIGDFVWDDTNGNGVQDAGEPGIPGVVVTLGGAASATTTTDATGGYVFGGLFAGTYSVTVTMPGGYSASPVQQGGDPLKDSDASPASVTLNGNAGSALAIDFGFVVNLAGQIGDLVWYDVDGNGIQDAAEPGIAGLTVQLSGPGGSQTTTTDGTGRYLFTGLAAGSYTVAVATPPGFVPAPTQAPGSAPETDSNGSPAPVTLIGNASADMSLDIGFTMGAGVIGDYVWEDLDGDGIQDGGEPGLAGLAVTLSGDASATTTTDAAGHYVFGSLFAGTYSISVTAPNGYSASPSQQGGDPLRDSNGSPATVVLTSNAASELSIDVGFRQTPAGEIGDFVWYDVNGNGLQDALEPGIGGHAVTMTGPGGPFVTTTDSTGHYRFAGLAAGSYTIAVATPSGFVPAPAMQGLDRDTDSDGSPATVVLATNTSSTLAVDVGFTQGTGAIGDFVWNDLNGNGIQDSGEPGLAGVQVILTGAATATTVTDAVGHYVFGGLIAGSYTITVAAPPGFSASPVGMGGDPLKDSNGSPVNVTLATNATAELAVDFGYIEDPAARIGDLVWYDVDGDGLQDAGEPGIAGVMVVLTGPGGPYTATTDAAGRYEFTALSAGSYTVTVSAPNGFVATPMNQGSDRLVDSNGSPAMVTLTGNQTVDPSIDIGFTMGTGVIGDFVWDDVDGDGIQDSGEPGFAGLTVTLSGDASATATTDASGHYAFAGLFAGAYTIAVATPAGYSPAPTAQGGDPLMDSNASPASVTLTTNASSDLSIDIGFRENQVGQLGDFVWYDVNANGIQDLAEPGIGGVTVTLNGPGGQRTTTTDGTGHYSFSGLGAGSYTISVAAPVGFTATPPAQGSDSLTDSNGSPATTTLPTNTSVDVSVDFGFTQGNGAIGDVVWNDLNGNGVQDAGEPGLGGVTVNLSGAASGSTTTDAAGHYVFGSLFAGTYTVTVATPDGYGPSPAGQGGDPLKDSNGSPTTLTLATNASADLSADFGFVEILSGQIGDIVWYDVNGNGVQDAAEPGIAGVTVNLAGPGGPLSATTDGTGHYEFTGLGAGSYVVTVAAPNGFIASPSAQGGDSQMDSNGSPATVVLANNRTVDSSIDVGFTMGVGAIGDAVWDDLDGNGVQDVGEPGLAGVTVSLSGDASASTVTDATGHYVFGNLFAGTYTVTVVAPGGYVPTPANQGSDPLKDSNVNPAAVSLATNAATDLSVDFGFRQPALAEIGDFVWYDVDANGVQDVAEPGIAGVTISLNGPGGPRTTTTDGTGHYSFSGLAAGTYTIDAATPNGFVTTPSSQGSDPAKDSNGSPASVTMSTSATIDGSVDFGFTMGAGALGNFIWNDLNGDGVQDPGEPGMAGVSVALSGAATAVTTTDSTGHYVFGGLFAGAYTISVSTPVGYNPTLLGQGGDPLRDSNGSPASVVLATNASADLSIDAGFVLNRIGEIGDVVWYDANGNGVQDVAEPGIAGVAVNLTGPGGPLSTTTDVAGHYVFSGLDAGSYSIAVATPNGYVPSPTAQGGDSLKDSNGNPATIVLATPSTSDLSVDFGFTKGIGSIGDFVWDDANGNGLQDQGEPGLAGVVVLLTGAASGSTTTASDGSYSFDGLFAGSYTISVSTPAGYQASPSNQGSDPSKDSDGSPAAVTLAANNSAADGIDFGFAAIATGQIGDLVWDDADGNGIQDPGEAGIAGATVTLNGPGGTQVATTDATGAYSFTSLAGGTYSVTVATPNGYILSPTAQGADPARDSNGSPASVTLATSSTMDVSVDVGFVRGTGSIGDFVWNDLNANGIQDAGEPGLAGVTVTLSGAGNASTITAANGSYAFAGLFAGSYTVTVVTPSGYSPTLSGQGGDPLKDSNGSPTSVTLATHSGVDAGVDFGFVQGQAIAVDRSSSSSTGLFSLRTLSWSHTIGTTGTNRILIVSVGIRANNTQTVASVKWGTAPMTRVGAVTQGKNVRAELWYLVNPPTGTRTIAVALAGGKSGAMAGGAVSFTGVHQTTPLGTAVTKAQSASTAASLTVSSGAGQVVIDVAAKQNSAETVTAGTGQTRHWVGQSGSLLGVDNVVASGSSKAGATTMTMSWTASAARPWALVAVPLKPAP
ncbi:MAG: hypothetical protein MNPFHGCM_03207 [Gemmatimonadaceae bacterium]|nr:hypothetical protein [Gemmatimonadaceae bacterium]